MKDTRQINQIANMALVAWNDNIAISDKARPIYWTEQVDSKAHLDTQRLRRQTHHYALPDGWVDLPFADFLAKRRKLMAAVVLEASERISRSEYDPHYPQIQSAAEALAAAQPTSGVSRTRGRVAALLEVGTGFHPELTGRENIFLNGAILGMSRADIQKSFDAIVDFSGVERFLDTPVKRYSSGMGLRLGFSVAAHLEPDILIVDEILAVGDAEFQRKCLGHAAGPERGPYAGLREPRPRQPGPHLHPGALAGSGGGQGARTDR